MNAIQLDFLRSAEECEIIALRAEVKEMRISLDKQRRAQFAKIGEVTKLVNDHEARLSLLERNLCKG